MASTKIEWADAVWNPITGCSPISEGCDHCYAKRMANRLRGRYGYPADDPFRVRFHRNRLGEPLKWKKPRRIFVCSMSDFFHDNVDPWWIDDILDVCRSANQHTYMFLTKRPQNIRENLSGCSAAQLEFMAEKAWIGVTAENQQRADERIPILLQIPAAVRFVSVEPMLSEIDLRIVPCRHCNHPGDVLQWPCPYCKGRRFEWLDWVIAGGETGPVARPLHPDWVRSLRDQCQAAGVPFFFKGWGDWKATDAQPVRGEFTGGGIFLKSDGTYGNQGDWWDGKAAAIDHIGKKAAGRMLDGREWNDVPKA